MNRCKVVVVGPAEAGKSTLVGLLSERAMNLERQGRTVAMDHGLLRRADAKITLVGVPGQPWFAPVREVLVQRARGAIWVHPAGQAADASTVELLQAGGEALPFVVLVNERIGGARGVGYEPPVGLHRPCRVFTGDLINDADLVGEIKQAIWNWLPQ